MMWWWGVAQRFWDSILWDPRPRPTHDWDTPLDGADQLAEKEAAEDVAEPRITAEMELIPSEPGIGINDVLYAQELGLAQQERVREAARAGVPLRVGIPLWPSTSAVVPAEPADSGEGVSVSPPAPSSPHPNFTDWAAPAICEVLAGHIPADYQYLDYDPMVRCIHPGVNRRYFHDWQHWREHISHDIAAHLEQAMEKRA